MDKLCLTVGDPNLRHTLSFGIGLHHAGLQERDRKIVEELFVNQKIQASRDISMVLGHSSPELGTDCIVWVGILGSAFESAIGNK